jgi:hypothetical protein
MTRGARPVDMPVIAVMRELQERRRVEPGEPWEFDRTGKYRTRTVLWWWRPMW